MQFAFKAYLMNQPHEQFEKLNPQKFQLRYPPQTEDRGQKAEFEAGALTSEFFKHVEHRNELKRVRKICRYAVNKNFPIRQNFVKQYKDS